MEERGEKERGGERGGARGGRGDRKEEREPAKAGVNCLSGSKDQGCVDFDSQSKHSAKGTQRLDTGPTTPPAHHFSSNFLHHLYQQSTKDAHSTAHVHNKDRT